MRSAVVIVASTRAAAGVYQDRSGRIAADWFGAGLSQASVAGRGGSVGAYLRFGLEDSLDPPAANLAFAAAVLAGLVLTADWLVRGIAPPV